MGRKRGTGSGGQWWAIGLLAVMIAATGGLVAAALAPKAPPVSANSAPGTNDYSGYFETSDETTRALFIGDSYTAGIGQEEETWASLLGRSMGWAVDNRSVGGSGVLNGEQDRRYLAQVESAGDTSPDIVVISGGRNDQWYGADELNPALDTLFATIRNKFPGAAVYMVAPWWDDDVPTEGFTVVQDAYADAAQRAGVVFVDAGQPLAGRSDLLWDGDGVHPNTAGQAALADAVGAAWPQ